jgi:hypothetical protein
MNLTLAVKRKYFEEIKNGTKHFEYRLQTPRWEKRLIGRDYEFVIITLGYPKKDDMSRRLVFPWRKVYCLDKFTHEHFGNKPVKVFAIRLRD